MTNWERAHLALTEWAKKRCADDWQEGRLLLDVKRTQAWRFDGRSSLFKYVEILLGYDGRTTADRIRVAEALERLPLLSNALRDGILVWSKVRELTRVAEPHTEKEWLEVSIPRTARAVEASVRGRAPGARPGTPPDPRLERFPLRLEFDGEGYARLMSAIDERRRQSRKRISYEEVLLDLVSAGLAALASPEKKRAGHSRPYQLALTVCEVCDRGWMNSPKGRVEASPSVVERAKCDSSSVGNVRTGAPEDETVSIPQKTYRFVMARAEGACEVPGCGETMDLEAHHIQFQCDGGTHHEQNLCVLCRGCHDSVHDGFISIRGPHASILFSHPDGRPMTDPLAPFVEPERTREEMIEAAVERLVTSRVPADQALHFVRIAVEQTPDYLFSTEELAFRARRLWIQGVGETAHVGRDAAPA